MTLSSLDFIKSEYQFLCGECMEIILPGELKGHLKGYHDVDIKYGDKEYINAMMNIYYFVVMPVSKFKESIK
jgi:hypothetical protein